MRAICKAGPKVLDKPVSDFMTTAVVTARGTDTSDFLMSEMTIHRCRYIPVVAIDRLIGIVSLGDLVTMHVNDAVLEAGAMRQYIATS
jgi:CBS domain-containing protein